MKQIFDWLREQIEEEPKRLRKMKNQCIALSDSEVLAIEEKAYGFYRQCIDEAEAKWETDCCEWSRMKYLEFSLSDCLTSCGHTEHYSTGIDKYCRHCGKPIKISEVE